MSEDLENGKKISNEGWQDPEKFVAPTTGYTKSVEQSNDKAQTEINDLGLEQNEFVLTPEIEEKVMGKVKDIDEYGTAFTSLTFAYTEDREGLKSRLKNVLQLGLLGNDGLGGETFTNREEFVKDWYQNVRERKLAYSEIYFNIVGRIKNIGKEKQIAKTGLIKKDGFGLLFDISKSKELPQGKYKDYSRNNFNVLNTFSADINKGTGFYVQMLQETIQGPRKGNRFNSSVDMGRGFVTPYRVAPRFFSGLVVNSNNPEIISSDIKTMVDIDASKPDRLLPVYNTDGDLLWPKQMTYKEVKQFVVERNAKKKEVSGTESILESEIQPDELS